MHLDWFQIFKKKDDAVPRSPESLRDCIDEATIPRDRTFRNAWKDNGTVVDHDMPKCREMLRERIRVARQPLLQALDAEYMKALETGDTVRQAEVIADKQVLRDAPADPAIAAARTPDELKAAWPAILSR